jgi:hypothetical protein
VGCSTSTSTTSGIGVCSAGCYWPWQMPEFGVLNDDNNKE